jgi:hypothetical protein
MIRCHDNFYVLLCRLRIAQQTIEDKRTDKKHPESLLKQMAGISKILWNVRKQINWYGPN